MKILLKALQHLKSRAHFYHNVTHCKRRLSTCWTLHSLKSRGVVQLRGTDVKPFLQGLITNDITQLGSECSSMYAMLLNVQGRVMYDLLLYQKVLDDGNPCVLLEHDRHVTSDFIKLLKRYKIRKKIDIADISDSLHVFAVLPPSGSSDGTFLSMEQASVYRTDLDPRVSSFGRRILSSNEDDIFKSVHQGSELVVSPEEDYHEARYRQGISEGIVDLPPGNCFPLESNLVYLNGACFQKGCYIGQELTARTFHTGVTRKRLMPLEFDSVPDGLSAGDNIVSQNGKSAGKFRNSAGKYGLGLVRMAEIKGTMSVKNKDDKSYNVQIKSPSWWPVDEQK